MPREPAPANQPKMARPPKTPLFGLATNDNSLFQNDSRRTNVNWFYRRILIFVVSFFCMGVISYAMLAVTPTSDSLYQAITYAAFSLLGIVVTGYAITASTEDTKTRELYLKYSDAIIDVKAAPKTEQTKE